MAQASYEKVWINKMLSVLMFYATLVGGVVLSFRHTAIFAFCTYQAIYFFNPEKRWWGNSVPDISYSFFIVLFMFFLFARNTSLYNQNKILTSKPLLWAGSVVFLYFIAYFYAVFDVLHWNYFVYFFKLFIIMLVAYKLITNKRDLTYVLYGYIFSAWYVSFYVFQIGRNSGNRVEGVGLVDAPDANGLAAAIAPSLVLCVYFFWVNTDKRIKLAFAFAGIFIANAIVLINSRGAFLGVAASVLFFMFYLYSSSVKRRWQKLSAVFMTVVGLSGGLYLADDDFISRMTGIEAEVESSEEQESGATRMVFWQAAWDMTKDYPYGNGYRGFNFYAPLYIPEDVNTGRKRSRSVHSTWFEVLTEVGYLGLFCFVMMLLSSWQAVSRVRRHLKKIGDLEDYYKMIAIQGAAICFVITMTFLNRMRAEVLYWLVMFAAAAYNIYLAKPKSEKVNENKI